MVKLKYKFTILFILQIVLILALGLALLLIGPTDISFSDLLGALGGANTDPLISEILFDFRFSKVITALAAGSALAVSGLLMQTYFNNFLAGPFVLGVHSGASLGVVIWIMGSSVLATIIPDIGNFGMPFSAFVGACSVLTVLILISPMINNKALLLVVGILFSYFVSGIISIFIAAGEAYEIKTFLIWSFGSFEKVSGGSLVVLTIVTIVGLIITLLLSGVLNVLSLGDRYAKSLGVSLLKVRIIIIIVTAMLSGIVTAYCGPVAFVGVIAPHIARFVFKTGDHRILLPGTIFFGMVVTLFAELFISLNHFVVLPLNAVLGIIGGPIIFAILWGGRRGASF